MYDELLADVPGVLRPRPPRDGECSWHLYVVGIDGSRVRIGRGEVIDALKADNIGTSVHFIPIHHHAFYQKRLGCKEGDFPNATRLYQQAISLPLFPTMRPEDVRAVVRSLARIVGGADVPDTGSVAFPRESKIAYLAQVADLPSGKTAREVVMSGLEEWSEAKARHDRLSAAIEP